MTTVEQLSLSLVREFLNRKCLKATLASMDAECPRTTESISSRTLLCKEMHLERLMKRNKEQLSPFKTIIEVIVGYFLERGKKSTSDEKRITELKAVSLLNEPTPPKEEDSDIKSGLTTNQTLVDNKLIHLTPATTRHVPDLGTEYDSLLLEENDGKNKTATTETVPDRVVHSNSIENSLATNPRRVVSTSTHHGSRHRDMMVTRTAQPVIIGSKSKRTKPLHISHKVKDKAEQGTTVTQSPLKIATKTPATSQPVMVLKEDTESAVVHSNSVVNKETRAVQQHTTELSLEDVDDDDTQNSTVTTASLGIFRDSLGLSGGRLISRETVKQLRKLLFGSSRGSFNDEWNRQNFVFSSVPGLEYGLIQHKGGPCGVLATVQAFVLKHLMFEGTASMSDKNGALVNAIVDILWKARLQDCISLALPGVHSSAGLTGDVLDELVVHERRNITELKALLQASLPFLTGQCGCVLLLISVILTRGMQSIVNEMDEPTNKLIGHHNYCTQDLVNLFLIGKAVSNTHDGVITLGTGNNSMQFKGLDCQSEIGFLSLFEYYKSCSVGKYYKQPTYPIWVVCSESHFSVLFNSSKDFFIRQPDHFDLLYFNGLGEQDEEIRLTIDITQNSEIVVEADDLVSPLELCIRTCWKNACIDWNGSEPLL